MARADPVLAFYKDYTGSLHRVISGSAPWSDCGYDKKLMPTIPFLDPAIERGMWWTLKVHGLKPMYYHGMLTGLIQASGGRKNLHFE